MLNRFVSTSRWSLIPRTVSSKQLPYLYRSRSSPPQTLAANATYTYTTVAATNPATTSPSSSQPGYGGKNKKNSTYTFSSLLTGGLVIGLGLSLGAFLQNYHAFQPVDKSLLLFKSETDEEHMFLDNHSLVNHYRNSKEFKESRYYDRIPSFFLNRMVTKLLFTGPGFLTMEPIVFEKTDGKEVVIFFHVGDQLKGTDGKDYIHRGFLATLMDDGLVRCALSSLPNHYAVTGTLDLHYESHVPENSYLVLKARLKDVAGRKAWVEGSIDIMKKKSTIPAVSGTMLAVEPRYAKYFAWAFV